MMQKPEQILVVITREAPTQPALERALLFAGKNTTISLFSAVYEPALELTSILASDERRALRDQYVDQRRHYLDGLVRDCQNSEARFETHVVWHKKTAQAVVEFTHEREFDLSIKRISSDADSNNPFIMPTDWHLLRFCASPLLLVRSGEWQHNGAVLGAVAPTSQCEEHLKLNHKIIDYTQYLATILTSQAHVINTHVTPTLDAPLEYPNINFEELRNKVTQLHAEKMQELTAQHPFAEQHIHVVEGIAEEKIPLLAQQINAQVVVMGTVGRTGLTAAFMGNTAERVLSRLQCEVLALKPDNFEI